MTTNEVAKELVDRVLKAMKESNAPVCGAGKLEWSTPPVFRALVSDFAGLLSAQLTRVGVFDARALESAIAAAMRIGYRLRVEQEQAAEVEQSAKRRVN